MENQADKTSDGLETENNDFNKDEYLDLNKDEYLSQDSSGEEVVPKELGDFSLPVEVWIHAWSFLDFNTCQKICTLVSKTWLNQIRNSSILSGEMKIFRSYTKKFEEFENANAVMSRWKKLKVLHVKSETEIQHFGSFSEHKLLEKIVVWSQDSPGNRIKSKELGSWGVVTQSWFNPKHPLNPATLENVVAIEIYLHEIPPNFEMKEMSQRMKNLEDLRISGTTIANVSEIISSFKNLKNVDFDTNCQHQDLIVTLNNMACLNLKISGKIYVNGGEEIRCKESRDIFEEAVKILNEKFPGKCEKFSIYGGNMEAIWRQYIIRFDGNIAWLGEGSSDSFDPDDDDEISITSLNLKISELLAHLNNK